MIFQGGRHKEIEGPEKTGDADEQGVAELTVDVVEISIPLPGVCGAFRRDEREGTEP